MVESAYIGQEPATQDDFYIRKAIANLAGSTWFPDPKYHMGIPRPYHDAPNEWNGANVVAQGFTLITICLVVACGRFYIRLVYKRVPLGMDDWFVIPSTIVTIGFLALIARGYITPYSCWGRHIYYCRYAQFADLVKTSNLAEIIFAAGIYCSKLSILCLNYRLSGGVSKRWRLFHWTFFTILVLFGLLSVFLPAFSCIPPSVYYSLAKEGMAAPGELRCIKPEIRFQIQNGIRGIHIATDLVLLTLPIIRLWSMQLSTRKKISIYLLFSIGILSVLSSVMRTVVISRDNTDLPFEWNPLCVWNLLDISTANILASLPMYYCVFNAIIEGSISFIGNSRRNMSLLSFRRTPVANSQPVREHGSEANLHTSNTSIELTYHAMVRMEQGKKGKAELVNDLER